jgi:pimeloyl-ACP methyl ester carboxylesterase
VDIVPRTERAGFERTRAFMSQQPEGFESLEAAAEAIARFRGGAVPKRLDSLAKTLRRGSDGRLHWHWDPRFLEGRERDFAERTARLSACARHLTAPTLLVRGGSSDVVSEDAVREFLALVPQAEYVDVAGAGHMLAGDSNTVFGRATLDFLARHVPCEGPPR